MSLETMPSVLFMETIRNRARIPEGYLVTLGDYLVLTDDVPKRMTLIAQHHALTHTNECGCADCAREFKAMDLCKCLHCGLFFCASCAEHHFSMTISDFPRKKQFQPLPPP